MRGWSRRTARVLFLPGGLLLFLAVVLLSGVVVAIPPSAVEFYYYAVFVLGMLLGWRFHSSRILSSLIVLLLSHRAIDFFSTGTVATHGPGRIAFETVAFLLPINFVLLTWMRERGLSLPVIFPRLTILFFEAVFVAFLCRPGQKSSPALMRAVFFGQHALQWTKIPELALFLFALAFGSLLFRSLTRRKPSESVWLWSLLSVLLGLQAGGAGRVGSAYFATAGLIFIASVIEDSYFLAYHDELTGLPARRALNDAMSRLEPPYAIAVVDIDHFKSVNDTYGHDTGDEVLRMVAARLGSVAGDGTAFRMGGEEFTILFPKLKTRDALSHCEELRTTIEQSQFRLRHSVERRRQPRGADRRSENKRAGNKKANAKKRAGTYPQSNDCELMVTVSIGIAESQDGLNSLEVLGLADKALYRAKHNGRNRVETAGARRGRIRAQRVSA